MQTYEERSRRSRSARALRSRTDEQARARGDQDQDVSRYPAGRVILIGAADIRSMTVLELARAAARARVSQARIPALMAGVMSGEGLQSDEIVEA